MNALMICFVGVVMFEFPFTTCFAIPCKKCRNGGVPYDTKKCTCNCTDGFSGPWCETFPSAERGYAEIPDPPKQEADDSLADFTNPYEVLAYKVIDRYVTTGPEVVGDWASDTNIRTKKSVNASKGGNFKPGVVKYNDGYDGVDISSSDDREFADSVDKNGDDIDKNGYGLNNNGDGVNKHSDIVDKNVDDTDKNGNVVDKNSDGVDNNVDDMDTIVDSLDKNSDGVDKNIDDMDTNGDNVGNNGEGIDNNGDNIDKSVFIYGVTNNDDFIEVGDGHDGLQSVLRESQASERFYPKH